MRTYVHVFHTLYLRVFHTPSCTQVIPLSSKPAQFFFNTEVRECVSVSPCSGLCSADRGVDASSLFALRIFCVPAIQCVRTDRATPLSVPPSLPPSLHPLVRTSVKCECSAAMVSFLSHLVPVKPEEKTPETSTADNHVETEMGHNALQRRIRLRFRTRETDQALEPNSHGPTVVTFQSI